MNLILLFLSFFLLLLRRATASSRWTELSSLRSTPSARAARECCAARTSPRRSRRRACAQRSTQATEAAPRSLRRARTKRWRRNASGRTPSTPPERSRCATRRARAHIRQCSTLRLRLRRAASVPARPLTLLLLPPASVPRPCSCSLPLSSLAGVTVAVYYTPACRPPQLDDAEATAFRQVRSSFLLFANSSFFVCSPHLLVDSSFVLSDRSCWTQSLGDFRLRPAPSS